MKQIVDKLNKIAKKIDESVEIPQTDLIIDSLDAITKAYGGTPNDSNLIVDKLEDIAGVAHSGITPSGNIEITENTAEGEPLDVSQYATATVNVAGGGDIMPVCEVSIIDNTGDDCSLRQTIYPKNSSGTGLIMKNLLSNGDVFDLFLTEYNILGDMGQRFLITDVETQVLTGSNLVNCTFAYDVDEEYYLLKAIDPTVNSSATITVNVKEPVK